VIKEVLNWAYRVQSVPAKRQQFCHRGSDFHDSSGLYPGQSLPGRCVLSL
jgi:hypothetical protein